MKRQTLLTTVFLLLILTFTFNKANAHPGDSCSSAISVTVSSYTDYEFQSGDSVRWFSFIADSDRMSFNINSPILSADTPFAHIDSLVIYSGSCGSLSWLKGNASNGPNNDTLPGLQLFNLVVGHSYYIKVSTYSIAGAHALGYFNLSVANLAQSIFPTTCTLSGCGPQLITDGTFENNYITGAYSDIFSPQYNPTGAPTGTTSLTSPWNSLESMMQYDNGLLVPGSQTINYTCIYAISNNEGSNYKSVDVSGSGHLFFGDSPSELKNQGGGTVCLDPLCVSPDTVLAWKQTPIGVIPGATYIFQFYVEDIDPTQIYSNHCHCLITNPDNGATLTLKINGTKYFQDEISNTNFSHFTNGYQVWQKICFNWIPSNTTADIEIWDSGASNPSGYDFGIDNISFQLAQLPSTTTASNNSPVCTGSTLNLTTPGTPGATYSWTGPNGFSSTSQNPSITNVTTAASGTYSVTVTIAGCGSSSGTTTVSILSSPTVTVNPQNFVLCPGSSGATLTASGASSYTWSPSSGLSSTTGSVVTASPSSITTYTVTGTGSNGCTATATATVKVDPVLNISISAFSNVCAGAPVTSTVSGGTSPYAYSWNPGGQTTANISTLATGTYTLTVTDNGGCTSTATTTFTVNPDCCYLSASCTNPVVVTTPASSSSYTFSNNPCISISGPGTFTISGSFTITNCDIAMGDGATIDVPNGATLTINNSRLYACGDMWQGIKVETGGTLYINGTSASSPCIIEDAIYGINLGGTATISYGLLNNNLYDIYTVGSGPNTNSSGLRLVSSKLSCQSDPGYSNNAYLKAPHLGAITNSGVYMANFPIPYGLVVGDNSSPSYQNTFNKMNYGVNANNAAFQVVNNLFENLLGSNAACTVSLNSYIHCPPPIGIAVLANNTPGGADAYLGGNWYYYAAEVSNNTMDQCYRGVDITDYDFPIITNNNLWNTSNVGLYNYFYYGDHGIYLKVVGLPLVENNTISNFATGIHINDFGFTVADTVISHTGYVSNNQISTTGGTTGVLTSGIIAENALTPFSFWPYPGLTYSSLSISDNTVTDAGSGCIQLSYVKPDFMLMSVTTNTLTILPSTSRTNRIQRSGIYSAASRNFIEYYNTINATGTYNSASPAGPADTSVIGIRAVINNNGIYECNNITNVGECMMYEGPNFPSKIYYNYMDDAYNAFVLESSGQVGQLGGSNDPIGDDWTGTFFNYQTYLLNSDATSSPIYVTSPQSPSNNGGNINSTAYGNPGTIYTTTGTIPSCPTSCTNCSFSSHSPQYRSFAQKIVDDSVPYSVFINESKYIGKQAIYTQINNDTTLMDSSTILHNFYNYTSSSIDTNNIGRLYNVNADITTGNYSSASTLNNSITPVNLIEQNQQLVNYVYLSTVAAGVDTATVADYDTLVGIATQCPVEGGDAVLEARGLLNLLFNTSLIITDSCMNDSSSGHAPQRRLAVNSTTITDNIQAKVYPNPANTLLNIEIHLQTRQIAYFEMYNSLGEEIENMELDNDLTTLPTNNLPAGMYYYRITDKNGNTIKADKQLLMH